MNMVIATGLPVVQEGLGDQTLERFRHVRARSVALAAGLSDADATAQSMEDASPAKWHLGHVTWFFETFVLRDHLPGYEAYDARWPFIFNSYYEAEGARIARPSRGLLTRPSLDEVRAYRAHVDAAIVAAWERLPQAAWELVELGTHHEEQHQELLQTDLLHLFAQNPLAPSLWPAREIASAAPPEPMRWIEGRAGLVEIGHGGTGFGFDCEGPRHTVWLQRHALSDRLVTNGEWRAFVEDGGYDAPAHWLSDGWDWVRANGIDAPLYWRRDASGRFGDSFGLDGLQPLDLAAPVTHVSLYEADAYAHWAGARLPTEAEWEASAEAIDASAGNFLDEPGAVRPLPARRGEGLRQMFGDVWQWTNSSFLAHPGFRAADGAIGEYNGKFMSGQFVLKGGSCATPRGHTRASYRNFFQPNKRWQFTGVRLARDL